MLKITTQDSDGTITLRLEGKLIGDWAGELRRLWNALKDENETHAVAIDLRSVTFVDAAGERLLREMITQGAEIFGAQLLVKNIVERLRAEMSVGQRS